MKKKDINQYRDLKALEDAYQRDVLDRRIDRSMKKFNKMPTEGVEVIPFIKPFTLVRPKSLKGSCMFGGKADWCIARDGNPYFHSYTHDEGKTFWFLQDHSAKPNDPDYLMEIQATISQEEGKKTPHFEMFWDRDDSDFEMDELKVHLGDRVYDHLISTIKLDVANNDDI